MLVVCSSDEWNTTALERDRDADQVGASDVVQRFSAEECITVVRGGARGEVRPVASCAQLCCVGAAHD